MHSMSLFQKLKEGLKKTQASLSQEIRRIVTLSPKLTKEGSEDLEAALLGADLGLPITQRILAATKSAYETQGRDGVNIFGIATREVEAALGQKSATLTKQPKGLTIISLVGVNGTGKTTTCAKLANRLKESGSKPWMAACDTFRAAAIDQLKLWSERLEIPITAGAYGADPASVAHDALSAAAAKNCDYLLIDTAGRLHTKHNLMKELEKLHRVTSKKLPGAPHEVLLVIDATTGMNALNQAREFNKTAPLTGLILTKLDGTSRGGMIVSIQQELDIPVKFIGVGEQADDLQPFQAKEFAKALFVE
ncbi:MAG: Signal recognition particle receptor FtsY [Verrucomicrobia subdivision 3 bacterium]|nr:Signal recognition particle receptor FtsY [Limisphaerales bacterium]MCS1413727.1 Signal recognition particle receptor FtsY [Limisphaerales bacterium]